MSALTIPDADKEQGEAPRIRLITPDHTSDDVRHVLYYEVPQFRTLYRDFFPNGKEFLLIRTEADVERVLGKLEVIFPAHPPEDLQQIRRRCLTLARFSRDRAMEKRLATSGIELVNAKTGRVKHAGDQTPSSDSSLSEGEEILRLYTLPSDHFQHELKQIREGVQNAPDMSEGTKKRLSRLALMKRAVYDAEADTGVAGDTQKELAGGSKIGKKQNGVRNRGADGSASSSSPNGRNTNLRKVAFSSSGATPSSSSRAGKAKNGANQPALLFYPQSRGGAGKAKPSGGHGGVKISGTMGNSLSNRQMSGRDERPLTEKEIQRQLLRDARRRFRDQVKSAQQNSRFISRSGSYSPAGRDGSNSPGGALGRLGQKGGSQTGSGGQTGAASGSAGVIRKLRQREQEAATRAIMRKEAIERRTNHFVEGLVDSEFGFGKKKGHRGKNGNSVSSALPVGANAYSSASKVQSLQNKPSDFLVPLSTLPNWKVYFCHECTIKDDDVKLRRVLERAFVQGKIDLETDAECNRECLGCRKMLNTKANLDSLFPKELENCLQSADAFNEWIRLNRRRASSAQSGNMISADVYSASAHLQHHRNLPGLGDRLLGGWRHREDTLSLANKDDAAPVIMSTADREFGGSVGIAQTGGAGSSSSSTTTGGGRAGGTTTSAKGGAVGANTIAPQASSKYHPHMTRRRATQELYDSAKAVFANTEAYFEDDNGGLQASGTTNAPGADLESQPQRVYLMNLNPNTWAARTPDFLIEVLANGKRVGGKYLPNVEHLKVAGRHPEQLHSCNVRVAEQTKNEMELVCSAQMFDKVDTLLTDSITEAGSYGNAAGGVGGAKDSGTGKEKNAAEAKQASRAGKSQDADASTRRPASLIRLVFLRVTLMEPYGCNVEPPFTVQVSMRPAFGGEIVPIYTSGPVALTHSKLMAARLLGHEGHGKVALDIFIPRVETAPARPEADPFVSRAGTLRSRLLFENDTRAGAGSAATASGMLYEYGGELKKKPCFRDLEHWFHLIQWHKIRDSSDYMMPYMFPIHLPTFRTEESFVIAPEVVGMLRDDADWSEGYARCVEILLAAWGYDLLQSRTTWRAESVGLLDTSVLDRRSLRGFHPGGGGRHQYSPDSWKLRHLLLSLRTFKIGALYEIVCEIGQDLLRNGVLLNLKDQGLEESLQAADGDIHVARIWLETKLWQDYSKKWIPTLEELLFVPLGR